MTDANGTANFTQQFAVNGQRGIATIFAMDGVDTTDPEMGGATFSNFNVDAIQEVQANSGVMPAEIGHGAAITGESLRSCATNLGSLTVARLCFHTSTTGAIERFISASTRDSGKCWGRRR